MRQSKVEVYVHLVWATKRRAAFLLPAVEAAVHEELRSILCQKGCMVLAINGMEDHVHVVTTITSTIAIASLAQHLKGETSNLVRDSFEMDDLFEWQERYAAFSVSRSHVRRVVSYVENQKRHHAANRLWPEWEEVDEDASGTDVHDGE